MKHLGILLLLIFSGPGFSQLLLESGRVFESQKLVWPGFWWPMKDADLALGWEDDSGRRRWGIKDIERFDKCLDSSTLKCNQLLKTMSTGHGVHLSPLMKFDIFVRHYVHQVYGEDAPSSFFAHATKRELEIHYIKDSSHPSWEAKDYAGKCIGWALSVFDFQEPINKISVSNIIFTPADIKGILATLYNGAQFFIPEHLTVGTSYRDIDGLNSKEAYDDVSPLQLLQALNETVAQGRPLEADLEPGDGVWNFPIYKFSLQLENKRGNVLGAQIHIWYANDEVDFEATSKAADAFLMKIYHAEFVIPENWDGDWLKIKTSRWVNGSEDNHPDALILGIEPLWRSEIYDYKNTAIKQEVNYQLLKRIFINKQWIPLVDILLNEYFSIKH